MSLGRDWTVDAEGFEGVEGVDAAGAWDGRGEDIRKLYMQLLQLQVFVEVLRFVGLERFVGVCRAWWAPGGLARHDGAKTFIRIGMAIGT